MAVHLVLAPFMIGRRTSKRDYIDKYTSSTVPNKNFRLLNYLSAFQGQQIDINTEIYKIVATPVIFPAPVIAKGYLSCVLPDGFIYLQIEDFGLSELRSLTVEPASDTPVESVNLFLCFLTYLQNFLTQLYGY